MAGELGSLIVCTTTFNLEAGRTGICLFYIGIDAFRELLHRRWWTVCYKLFVYCFMLLIKIIFCYYLSMLSFPFPFA